MKDWEVKKVNALYLEIDQLKEQNQQMAQRLHERSGAFSAVVERLDQMQQTLESIECKCTCHGTSKPVTRKKTK
jgi:septation ring formation regulator EzrA